MFSHAHAGFSSNCTKIKAIGGLARQKYCANVCMYDAVHLPGIPSRLHSFFKPSFPGIGFGCSMTLTGMKHRPKLNEFIILLQLEKGLLVVS